MVLFNKIKYLFFSNRNSLNDYAIEVKKSQKKTFIPIYPILTELIGKGE